ncbi:hypothetical protein WA026_005190 [Henosepilachna vigintioctopunctata]|uniref:ATP synthase subunit b n=1 Tax=Henosepilachna vigintioctopunctata TaxID=420089 RepID=A0AAW1UWC5_9CUCU
MAEFEKSWVQNRQNQKDYCSDGIELEKKLQSSMEAQTMLSQAKRENVALQLEANYRQKLMTVFNLVKKRLEYQSEKQNIERRIAQKNLVEWVVAKVKTSITPDQEKQNIDRCIADLANLSKA